MANFSNISFEEFVKERNKVFFSYDETKIKAYMQKYGVPIPDNETVFWAMVNKCICNVTSAPPELVAKAEKWLSERGMSKEIR